MNCFIQAKSRFHTWYYHFVFNASIYLIYQSNYIFIYLGCQPCSIHNSRHPGSSSPIGSQMAPEKDQAPPEAGSEALPGGC